MGDNSIKGSLKESFREADLQTVCCICPHMPAFINSRDFCQHLQNCHCVKNGRSFICQYGKSGVCASLPAEGVCSQDYIEHVIKHHFVQKGYPSDGLSSMKLDNEHHNLQKGERLSIMVDDYDKWTVHNSSQNLPAVLNDPRRSKRELDFFIKTWGDSFVEQGPIPSSPYIPEITRKHFDTYLRRINKRYLQHLKQTTRSSISSTEEARSDLKLLPAARWQDKRLPDIDTVPKIFLQSDFSLHSPETFKTVLPWACVQSDHITVEDFNTCSSSKLLQEKLGHYLDIVEVQIARQISLKSKAFFHAMTSHDALMDQLTHTIRAVEDLRNKIKKIDEALVKGALQVIHLQKKRLRLHVLFNKAKVMATVHQTQPTIQLLLSTSDFVGAIDLIYTTQKVLIEELAGIHCFRHLGSQLAEMEKVIDKMMQTEFTHCVSSELHRPLTDQIMVLDIERLVAVVFGMLRIRRHDFVEVYKKEACTAIKAVVKQTKIEVVAKEDFENKENTASGLADQLKTLDILRWMATLDSIFTNLIKLIHRIQAMHGILQDAITLAAKNSTTLSSDLAIDPEATNLTVPVSSDLEVTISESEYNKLTTSLKDLLCSVCDNAHEQCAKFITARAEDGSLEKLSTEEFGTLARSIENFSKECEYVCGRRSTSLRLALQTQANRFVTKFHEERKTKLSLILDNEPWKQADVPVEFQDLVDHVLQSGMLTLPKRESNSINTPRNPRDHLIVGDETFKVVGTVLILLKMIVEYCQCAEDNPMVSPDLLTRLLDLLKNFNSRTCQLVLGAGAIQLTGLKTITTRNLALASRCLQLVAYFIPMVKNHFTHLLPSKQQFMSKHFDQILKDYTNHTQEIVHKLITIIDHMFELQLSKWEVKAPVPSSCFRAISKQLNKLHEAVSDLLPPDQLQDIFYEANLKFKVALQGHLNRLHIRNDGGPQQGIVTQELTFYVENLKNLDVLRDINHSIEDLWATT
ncbi:vacuolar protein sorting-associated protein 54-like isoform X2 [Limulus polyphemus]|uniref:Vacuolar protein sorting-associated protein 54 n=1 Tax=Limulus polyphemus TaxID=6850 RepID=A0ABM1S7D1_LIMPO|nr:vacuolar protein sorting-associated protein 54-like isoform X2 [Limulus polyphemus]